MWRKPWTRRALAVLLFVGLLLPRLPALDAFFIQDEALWLDRSQLYVRYIGEKNWDILHQYPPFSLHPGATLLPIAGMAVSAYGAVHGLDGTYASWGVEDQRAAAALGRFVMGTYASVLLFALYRLLLQTRLFAGKELWAGAVVLMLGLEPWVWGISRTVHLDAMLSLFLLIAVTLSVIAKERSNWRWTVSAGAAFGLAFMTKSPAVNFLPVVLLPLLVRPFRQWRTKAIRDLVIWAAGAVATIFIAWPPMWFHPILRFRDIMRDMFSHVEVPEMYVWPGPHVPLFLGMLSIVAVSGCVLYLILRLRSLMRDKRGGSFLLTDLYIAGGILFAVLLLAVGGDHARKNLPVLAFLSVPGTVGWLLVSERLRVYAAAAAATLIAVSLWTTLPWFPHLPTFHNPLLRSAEGKRLLVDVGNGSRLVADAFNAKDQGVVFATNLPGLIQPYLTEDRRGNVRRLPRSGKLADLDKDVQVLVIPESFPARINFDASAMGILAGLGQREPETVLRVHDVPLFSLLRIR